MECIILAGGMGTRLQSVVSDVPKCMAPVAGHPFLHYLITTLIEAGFKHIILSLGYKHEIIEEWLGANRFSADISTVVEEVPLGTGGAVKLALSKARTENVFVLNGDTFFGVNYFLSGMHSYGQNDNVHGIFTYLYIAGAVVIILGVLSRIWYNKTKEE